MRKPRPDAKLLQLPDDQQVQLAEWLLSGMPYHRARELVEKEFGVKAAIATFGLFWEQVCAPVLIAKRARAVGTAEAVAQEAERTPGRFDAATIDALKQRAFELSISPGADPKNVKALFSLVLKARDQQIDEQQLALDRQRFQRETAELFLRWSADQRAAEIAASTSTNGEKIDRLGHLMFGEGWK